MNKRKLRRVYRRYLFSYTFEILTPRAIVEVDTRLEVPGKDDNTRLLFSLAALLLAG